VNPVTYPAVLCTKTLRISLMATHDEGMLQRALQVFAWRGPPPWRVAASPGRLAPRLRM
jgi:hypothetical protein